MKVERIVVTRLAVKLWYEAFSPEWLEERLRLFRTYCVPGMARQTRTDYRWLVLCDESVDESFIESIQGFSSIVPQLGVVLTSQKRDVEIPDAIAASIDQDTEVLTTTRLDGDDCLHEEAMQTVAGYVEAFLASPEPGWVLNFPRGYRYAEADNRLYASHWWNSPFSTMFEKLRPGKPPRFDVHRNHRRLHLYTPMHADLSIPGWIQVIHGTAEQQDGIAEGGGNRSSSIKRTDIEIDPAEVEGFSLEAWQRA